MMLPMLSVKQSIVLPPEPQPEAEELDRLLELTVDEPDDELLSSNSNPKRKKNGLNHQFHVSILIELICHLSFEHLQ